MAGFGAAVGIAFAEESAKERRQTEDENFELSDLSSPVERRFSEVEKQLRDEQELIQDEFSLDAGPKLAYAPGVALQHVAAVLPASSPPSIKKVASAASAFTNSAANVESHQPSSFASRLRSTSAARSRQILLKFKIFAKRWLWRERRRLEGSSKHQKWWLISGTERALKRSESIRNKHGDSGLGVASIDQFMPVAANREINQLPWYLLQFFRQCLFVTSFSGTSLTRKERLQYFGPSS